jgi:hypothetical protein
MNKTSPFQTFAHTAVDVPLHFRENEFSTHPFFLTFSFACGLRLKIICPRKPSLTPRLGELPIINVWLLSSN